MKKLKSVLNVQITVLNVTDQTTVPFVKNQNSDLHQNVNVSPNTITTVLPLVNLVPHNVLNVKRKPPTVLNVLQEEKITFQNVTAQMVRLIKKDLVSIVTTDVKPVPKPPPNVSSVLTPREC